MELHISEKRGNTAPSPTFKYTIDEFADIKIMRYEIPGWETLSLKQKKYIYHLSEAAKWGRDILWQQNFKYNLKIRRVLEKIIENFKGDTTSEEYAKFLIYAKRVFFSNGIHHHYSEDKILPGCEKEYFSSLMQDTGQEDLIPEILPLVFDPKLYPYRKNISGKGDLLLKSAVGFYENISRNEAESFYRKYGEKEEEPLSFGLNSRLVKKNGEIEEEIYKSGGVYGEIIDKIITELEKAAETAEYPFQTSCINLLIRYYKTGNLSLWNAYNIEWVKDTVSFIDFINGFIETYSDPLGIKATWEALVNIKDEEASRRTELLSVNAQWFEDRAPVNPAYRKKNVKGISAKVINVVQLGGDCYPVSPLGINLPNADWIRKKYGSKSVTLANIGHAYTKASEEAPKSIAEEFSWDKNEFELIRKYGELASLLHTDLHECLGHGSGQLAKGTPANALKEYASALEEARADIFALYYIADSKLPELGLLPDEEAYKAAYTTYIQNGIFTQFVRIDYGKTVTQAHMQCRKLISEWSYEKGKKENVIERKTQNGKTYFVINDYKKLRKIFSEILYEIQRIKSEGDYDTGKRLIETYAVNIEPDLHKEVLERYERLNLKPYGGFINPNISPVFKEGKLIDYRLEYSDYIGQMLEYGKYYSLFRL